MRSKCTSKATHCSWYLTCHALIVSRRVLANRWQKTIETDPVLVQSHLSSVNDWALGPHGGSKDIYGVHTMDMISIHAYMSILVGTRPRWLGLLIAIAQGLPWLIPVMPREASHSFILQTPDLRPAEVLFLWACEGASHSSGYIASKILSTRLPATTCYEG